MWFLKKKIIPGSEWQMKTMGHAIVTVIAINNNPDKNKTEKQIEYRFNIGGSYFRDESSFRRFYKPL